MNTADALYRGWDADLVRERRTGFDAEATWVPASSGFTAINQQQDQLLTTQSSAVALVQQNQARRKATGQTKRRRNPTVAQYLGLGSSDEPSHLEKYAPLPDGSRSSPPKPARKRQKVRGREKVINHFPEDSESTTNGRSQRRVSEGLRVTKPRSKTAKGSKPTAEQATEAEGDFAQPGIPHLSGNQHLQAFPHDTSHHVARETPFKVTDRSSQDTYSASGDFYTDTRAFEPGANEYHIDGSDPFPTVHSDVCAPMFDDDDFDDGLDDDELLQLTSDIVDGGDSTVNLSSSPMNPQVALSAYDNQPVPGSSAATPILMEEESTKRVTKKFKSPTTLTTRLLAATGDIDTAAARKPIARPPFPSAVRDRSPIIGLSSNIVLRTCFRIGEAINQAHQASKTGQAVTFELYARVLDSQRDGTSQRFTFCDLFHGKPPYLKAVYDAALWKSVQLFNYDSKRLLQQGRIGRCIGTMKRDGKEWIMTVVNVWEATFEDIKWVEGIVNS